MAGRHKKRLPLLGFSLTPVGGYVWVVFTILWVTFATQAVGEHQVRQLVLVSVGFLVLLSVTWRGLHLSRWLRIWRQYRRGKKHPTFRGLKPLEWGKDRVAYLVDGDCVSVFLTVANPPFTPTLVHMRGESVQESAVPLHVLTPYLDRFGIRLTRMTVYTLGAKFGGYTAYNSIYGVLLDDLTTLPLGDCLIELVVSIKDQEDNIRKRTPIEMGVPVTYAGVCATLHTAAVRVQNQLIGQGYVASLCGLKVLDRLVNKWWGAGLSAALSKPVESFRIGELYVYTAAPGVHVTREPDQWCTWLCHQWWSQATVVLDVENYTHSTFLAGWLTRQPSVDAHVEEYGLKKLSRQQLQGVSQLAPGVASERMFLEPYEHVTRVGEVVPFRMRVSGVGVLLGRTWGDNYLFLNVLDGGNMKPVLYVDATVGEFFDILVLRCLTLGVPTAVVVCEEERDRWVEFQRKSGAAHFSVILRGGKVPVVKILFIACGGGSVQPKRGQTVITAITEALPGDNTINVCGDGLFMFTSLWGVQYKFQHIK